ncbi:hypothetical protein B0J12DRAFT_680026, partial [Macrophomina phaseolina]
MDLKHINHVLAVDLDWVVASNVFVKWHDGDGFPQYLGRLPPYTGNAGLSLMLGRSKQDAHDQLLLFHLAVRLHASSKERPQDFFLPIPADFFDTGDPLNLSNETAKNIVPIHWQVKQSALAELERVMRVKISLRYPGFVIMPAINRSKKVLGTPRKLLLLLRSLSQATTFDAFLPDYERPKTALDALATGVRQGLMRTSPLRFRSMFDGRSGKRNNWEVFGMAEDGPADDLDSDAVEAPPCYSEGGAIAAILEGDKARADAGHAEAEPEPTQLFTSLEPTQADTPSDYIQVWRSACQSSRHDSGESTSSPDAVSDSVLRPSPPVEAAPGAELRDQKRPRSSGSDGATSRFSPNKRRAAITTPPYYCSLATGPPSSRDRPVASFHAMDGDGAVSLFDEMATWLYHAWDLDWNTHLAMQNSLLALGYHARESSLADFDVVKGRCTSELVFRPEGVLGSDERIMPRHDIAEMVTWANSLLRRAEQVLFVELKGLADAARDGNGDGYRIRRSWWIARVFFLAGTEEHAVNFARSWEYLSGGLHLPNLLLMNP